MSCKLCGEDKKLIEAHIIPRSFYKVFKDNGKAPITINDQPGIYPKRSQIGIYDKEILCEDCERIFSTWDDYGYRFLSQEFKEEGYIYNNDLKIAYNFGSFEYENLVMFFLSVLWRAEVSSNKVFYRVQLGPYEKILREVISSRTLGDNQLFSVALSKFDADASETGILNPDRTEYEGVNHYRLYLGGYMVIIKVTNKQPPECFDWLYLKPESDAYCIIRPFKESKEYKAMVHTAKNAYKPVVS